MTTANFTKAEEFHRKTKLIEFGISLAPFKQLIDPVDLNRVGRILWFRLNARDGHKIIDNG